MFKKIGVILMSFFILTLSHVAIAREHGQKHFGDHFTGSLECSVDLRSGETICKNSQRNWITISKDGTEYKDDRGNWMRCSFFIGKTCNDNYGNAITIHSSLGGYTFSANLMNISKRCFKEDRSRYIHIECVDTTR